MKRTEHDNDKWLFNHTTLVYLPKNGIFTIALSVWLLDHYGFAAIHRLSKVKIPHKQEIYYTKKTEKNLGFIGFPCLLYEI